MYIASYLLLFDGNENPSSTVFLKVYPLDTPFPILYVFPQETIIRLKWLRSA